MQSLGDDSDADLDDEDSEEETPAKKVVIEFNQLLSLFFFVDMFVHLPILCLQPESGKKRTNVDAKTPESKKAKLVTPQKTGDSCFLGC